MNYWSTHLVLIGPISGKMQVSYNIMINIYASAGLPDEVAKLFEAMQRDGFSPNSSTYLYLVQVYVECLKYAEAEQTISSMRKMGIPPTCAHFNCLLYAFAKVGMMTEAERVYKELITTGISPNLACYRNMLRGYIDYGLVEEGINFFEQIRDAAGPDSYIMSAAVHIYKYKRKEPEARIVRNSMTNLRIPFLKHLKVGSKM